MIRVQFYLRDDGVLTGFKSAGHAEHGRYGHDIVCAAISALTEATADGLAEVIGLKLSTVMKDGLFEVCIEPGQGEELVKQAQVLLSTLELALNNITKQYPGCVRVDTKQWR